MAQVSLQVINFLLHDFGIFLLGDMATTPRMALTSMGSMYTSPPGLSFTQVHGSDLDVETPWILLGLNLNLP